MLQEFDLSSAGVWVEPPIVVLHRVDIEVIKLAPIRAVVDGHSPGTTDQCVHTRRAVESQHLPLLVFFDRWARKRQMESITDSATRLDEKEPETPTA